MTNHPRILLPAFPRYTSSRAIQHHLVGIESRRTPSSKRWPLGRPPDCASNRTKHPQLPESTDRRSYAESFAQPVSHLGCGAVEASSAATEPKPFRQNNSVYHSIARAWGTHWQNSGYRTSQVHQFSRRERLHCRRANRLQSRIAGYRKPRGRSAYR